MKKLIKKVFLPRLEFYWQKFEFQFFLFTLPSCCASGVRKVIWIFHDASRTAVSNAFWLLNILTGGRTICLIGIFMDVMWRVGQWAIISLRTFDEVVDSKREHFCINKVDICFVMASSQSYILLKCFFISPNQLFTRFTWNAFSTKRTNKNYYSFNANGICQRSGLLSKQFFHSTKDTSEARLFCSFIFWYGRRKIKTFLPPLFGQ